MQERTLPSFNRFSAYYLLGYLDEKCTVPFIQTLIFLRIEEREAANGAVPEYVFADAIAWYQASMDEDALDSLNLVYVAQDDIGGVAQLPEVLAELSALL